MILLFYLNITLMFNFFALSSIFLLIPFIIIETFLFLTANNIVKKINLMFRLLAEVLFRGQLRSKKLRQEVETSG